MGRAGHLVCDPLSFVSGMPAGYSERSERSRATAKEVGSLRSPPLRSVEGRTESAERDAPPE
jgi:hypothetical protein